MDEEKENPNMVNVDGGVLEGGGQILRISVSLSAIKSIPIRVYNIRAGRSSPGLRPQHIAGLQLVRDICQGTLKGDYIGSTEIHFTPGPIRGGEYRADPQTAGSIALLMQVSVPVALFAERPVTLNLRGATNADLAPPIDYMKTIFKPLLERFGGKVDVDVNMRGYFPRGGGQVVVHVSPLARGVALRAVQMLTRGPVLRVWGASFVAGALPVKVAQVMTGRARGVIHQNLQGAGTSIALDITAYKEQHDKAVATGSGINLFAETGEGYLLGTSGIGKPKILAESVAEKAALDLIDEINRGSCVDRNAQDQASVLFLNCNSCGKAPYSAEMLDQMVLLMALASGTSKILCGELTLHTKTAIYVTELLTKAKFKESKGILECIGIGHNT